MPSRPFQAHVEKTKQNKKQQQNVCSLSWTFSQLMVCRQLEDRSQRRKCIFWMKNRATCQTNKLTNDQLNLLNWQSSLLNEIMYKILRGRNGKEQRKSIETQKLRLACFWLAAVVTTTSVAHVVITVCWCIKFCWALSLSCERLSEVCVLKRTVIMS